MLFRTLPLLISICSLSSMASSNEAIPLLEKTIDRYHAFTSGRLDYTYSSTSTKNVSHETVAFSMGDWIKRWPGHSGIESNFKGMKYSYLEYPADPGTGKGHARMNVDLPESLADFPGINKPPYYAGSFWHSFEPDYLLTQKDKFQLKRSVEVDGIKTQVCEIELRPMDEVPPEFFPILPGMIETEGRILRLYIAPQLGYVLPLYEYLTLDGSQVLISIQATGFKEYSGLWLPQQMSRTVLFPKKPHGKMTFDITYSQVNQPIPDSEFIFPLKPDTLIHDSVRRRTYKLHSHTTSDAVGAGHFIGEPDPNK